MLTLQQIRDATQASAFTSPEELRAWLQRAFGAKDRTAVASGSRSGQAVALSPLEGDGYVLVGEFGLSEDNAQDAERQIARRSASAPYDGDVMYEVGKQLYAHGDFRRGMLLWAKCFANPGPINYGSSMYWPAECRPALFSKPCSPTDKRCANWARYRQLGQPQDLLDLVDYAAQVTQPRRADQERHSAGVYLALSGLDVHRLETVRSGIGLSRTGIPL